MSIFSEKENILVRCVQYIPVVKRFPYVAVSYVNNIVLLSCVVKKDILNIKVAENWMQKVRVIDTKLRESTVLPESLAI